MRKLISSLFLVLLIFSGCQKDEDVKPDYSDGELFFLSDYDPGYEGMYQMIFPGVSFPCYCYFLELKADGTFVQMEFVPGTGWEEFVGGYSGTWVELQTDVIQLTGIHPQPTTWIDIASQFSDRIFDNQSGNEFLRRVTIQ